MSALTSLNAGDEVWVKYHAEGVIMIRLVMLLVALCALSCGSFGPSLPPSACIQGLEAPSVLIRPPAGSLACDLLPPR